MALVFGGATSNKVDCGSAAVLDDLTVFSWLMWVYPTTRTGGRRWMQKGRVAVSPGGFKYISYILTSGNVVFEVARATQSAYLETNSTPISTNRWQCIAVSYSEAAATISMRVGTLFSPLSTPTYNTNRIGSGATTADNADTLVIGNNSANASAFQGSIAYVAAFRRVLHVTEEISWQFNPRILPGCVGFWRLGGRYGTAVQQDESGFANHGTVTGATANTLEPPLYISPPRRIWYVPEVVVAGTAVPVFYRHLQTQGIA